MFWYILKSTVEFSITPAFHHMQSSFALLFRRYRICHQAVRLETWIQVRKKHKKNSWTEPKATQCYESLRKNTKSKSKDSEYHKKIQYFMFSILSSFLLGKIVLFLLSDKLLLLKYQWYYHGWWKCGKSAALYTPVTWDLCWLMEEKLLEKCKHKIQQQEEGWS